MLMSYTKNSEQKGNDQFRLIVQTSEPIEFLVWPQYGCNMSASACFDALPDPRQSIYFGKD